MAPSFHEFLVANKNFFNLTAVFLVALVLRRHGLLRKKEVDALSRLCFTVCFPALLFASIYETKLNSELWLVPCTSFAFHAAYVFLARVVVPRLFSDRDENYMGILLATLGQNYGLLYPMLLGTSLRDTNAFAAVVLFDLGGNAILILIYNDFLAARMAPSDKDEAKNPMARDEEDGEESPCDEVDPGQGDAMAMMVAAPPRRVLRARAVRRTLQTTARRLLSSPPLLGEALGMAFNLLPVKIPGPVVDFAKWVGQPYSLILFVIIALTIDVPDREACKVVARVLGFRFLVFAAAAACFMAFFPALGGARAGIVIGLFTPLSSMNVRYLIENKYPAASRAIYASVFTVSNVVSFVILWLLIARFA